MPKKTQKKPVNKNAGRGNDTNRAPEKKNGAGKTASRWRDIVMLVVIAVCILSVISMFTPAIGWLKTALTPSSVPV